MKVAYSQTHAMMNMLRHYREQPQQRGFDEDGKERVDAVRENLEQKAKPVADDVEKIFTNPRLSDEGKQTEAMKVGPAVVSRFEFMGVALNQADHAKARLETMLFGPLTEPPKDNAVVTFLREDSIRRSIGKGQAGAAFLEAGEKGNLEMARAILDWPGGHGLSGEIERRGKEAYAQRTNPEGLEQLKYVEFLRDNLSVLAGQVAKWLLSLGASPESIQKAVKAKD